MRIIDERDKRNKQRKRMKAEYDNVMKLSAAEPSWNRLIQEGMITYSDGSPYFYINRGTLKAYYDELDPEYEGSVNVGHTDMATFPERIVGKWTKNDLRLVDAGDGRQALEVRETFKRDHPLIKALEMADFDLGLSVEMQISENEELTRDRAKNPFGVPIIDKLFIHDYAIVGNAGDVNSMGIKLKGELIMDEKIKKLMEMLENEGSTDISRVTELIEQTLAVEPKAEEELSEPEKESEEELAEPEKAPEGADEPETDLSEEDEEEELSTGLADVLEEIKSLKDQIETLKADLADRDAKLAAKEKAEKDFVTSFKNLSVSLTKGTKSKAPIKSDYTDGIGD